MATYPRTWAEINIGALKHNLAQIRAALPPTTKLALVTKADGYGHGLVPVARAASRFGADYLGVATIQEGVALREAEIDTPVIVLGPTLPMEAKQAVYYDLTLMLESFESAEAISSAAAELGKTARIHLKIDTGMSRFGVAAKSAPPLAARIAALPAMDLEGASTHFANSAKEPEYTAMQYELFRTALCEMEALGVRVKVRHCANSGALVKFPSALMDMARIGILAYGVSHTGETGLDLRPALTWRARILAMRDLPPGTKVSYNLTFETEKPSRIATVGVGYGDGYHRFLGNKGCVWLHGSRAPIRGVVCMDQMMVDVTDIPDAKIGDPVGLIEGPVSAEYLAQLVGTTPHEITTRIMSRVPRAYLQA